MSSKQQTKGTATDKNVVETADPTVDDDNQSDSEYEYEYIEVEVDDDYEEEIEDETGSKVMISEVETIVPKEEKKPQETLVLKSDGTTQKLMQKSKTVTRTVVNQEKQVKQEKLVKQTSVEKLRKQASVEKTKRASAERLFKQASLEKTEKHSQKVVKTEEIQKVERIDHQTESKFSASVQMAKAVKEQSFESQAESEQQEVIDKPRLGRALTSQEESILLPLLQGLLAANGNDAVSKSKHENTPFGEKETPTSIKNSRSNSLAEKSDKSDLAQGANILDELSTALNRLQSTLLEEKEVVTDTRKRNTILTLVAWLKRVLQTSTTENTEAQLFSLTELLPTELLLSKLMPQLNNGNEHEIADAKQADRSPSSKRFSRQRNNRFNTVGVSKEELADARLYLQKKLLSENLATSATKLSHEVEQHAILDDSDDSRRKSLHMTSDLDKDIRNIFRQSKNSFSKSIDLVAAPEDVRLKHVFPMTSSTTRTEQAKSFFRRKSNPSNNFFNQRDVTTDSDDDEQQKTANSAVNKSMNKFAMRKLKMKRANTIDIPKEHLDSLRSDEGFSDDFNKNTFDHRKSVEDIRHNIAANVNSDVDKNHMPDFKLKTDGDRKFIAFLNKNAEENHSSWVNPNKITLPVTSQQKAKAYNWSSKFGSIKNSFEQHEAPQLPVSPRLSKKNNFTHAPTSPFLPVQTNKPPQVPNGIHHQYSNSHSVHNKVAAYQALDKAPQPKLPSPKPQLRSYQSVPSYSHEDNHQVLRDSNIHMKPNDWQPSPYNSTEHYTQNPVSPKIQHGSQNPLYAPPTNQYPSQSPSSSLYASPQSHQMTPKSQVSASPNEFPTYTYTSTDYTQPSCVSTFVAETTPTPVVKDPSPVIKTTILPDNSYLKSQSPPRKMPPLLGSSRLNKQMKTVDAYSSNEYLSEPNNYYRTPQPFSPTYDYSYAPSHTSHDSRRSSGEFMATSHIMKYPQSQTATIINNVSQRHDDEQQAANLRSFLTNNRNEKRKSEYSERSSSPFSETNFSHVNQTYVPPQEPTRPKPNNFVSMENISSAQFSTPEMGQPIRLRNNTAYYGSHNVLVSNQNDFPTPQTFTRKFEKPVEKPKMTAPVRLNSYGGQYVQPKVQSDLDFSKPTYGRKAPVDNSIRNNVNLNRSNTITHQRINNADVKRKQSLPAQNTDIDGEFDYQYDATPPGHNYLPFGALKKSKSTHTLQLLQQFENKKEEAPLPSYIRRPVFNAPEPKPTAEIKPKSIIKKTPKVEETRPIQQAPIMKPVQPAPMPVIKPVQQQAPQPAPRSQFSSQQSQSQYQHSAIIRPKSPPRVAPRPKTPPQVMPIRPSSPAHIPFRAESPPHVAPLPKITPQVTPVRPMSPPQVMPVRPETPPEVAPIRPVTPPQTVTVRPATPPQIAPARPKSPPRNVAVRPKSPPQKLEPPEITETPSSPLVEDGHIIFPGQTKETKRRVQHYAQTLNAILNRKSVVTEESEETTEQVDSKPLQRSKSGTLLTVPKQYESAIRKSEVTEKERTVAAYFARNKSPQSSNLQRSSSQQSVQSSSSFKTVEEQKSSTASPAEGRTSEMTESSSRVTTTTTKSAHHMKILRKKQSSPNPLAKSQTLPSINLLDESNVDDAFDDLFASFAK